MKARLVREIYVTRGLSSYLTGSWSGEEGSPSR